MGIPREMFVDNVEDFICPICMDVVDLPRRTPCHTFCGRCLNIWLQQSPTCPCDRNDASSHRTDAEYWDRWMALRAKCYFHEMGCPEITTVGDIDLHAASCEFLPRPCWRGCNRIIPQREAAQHDLLCPNAINPVLMMLVCFQCRHDLSVGRQITHCDYVRIAREIIQAGSANARVDQRNNNS
jgi:hypothetical protein